MRKARLFKASKGFGLDRFGSVRGKKEEMEEGIGLFLGEGPFLQSVSFLFCSIGNVLVGCSLCLSLFFPYE